VFDQKPLYEGWRFKPLINVESGLTSTTPESVNYVRGLIPDLDTSILRDLWLLIDQLGIHLPNFTLLGEISTE